MQPAVVPPSISSSDDPAWWRDAVFYQVYIRSFADGNGDGVGDLAGIRSRLPYLADLVVERSGRRQGPARLAHASDDPARPTVRAT